MSRFWSSLTHDLRPYVPGEQPRMVELVKLNTNENPFGPSPRVLEAIRGEATDALRLYPDPQATALRAALATYHRVRPISYSSATARTKCWRTPSPLC
jgi:histidinol-phosphate aminotransferase